MYAHRCTLIVTPHRHMCIPLWLNKQTCISAAILKFHGSSSKATRLLVSYMSTHGNLFAHSTLSITLINMGPTSDHGATKTTETVVRARKMVVLTSGTLSTPQVRVLCPNSYCIANDEIRFWSALVSVERASLTKLVSRPSSVGPGQPHLIYILTPISDLPGVGKQYQDHYTTFSVFRARASEPTGDDFLRGDPKVQEEWFRLHTATGKGPAASNGIDAGFKIRPTEEELKDMGPAFQKAWESYFKVREN